MDKTFIGCLGKLRYYPTWVVADIGYDFSNYYRSLIPKYYKVNPPKYQAHITVVRKDIEQVPLSPILDGSIINIRYDPNIQFDGTYWFINCWSDDILFIRRQLGLPDYRMNNCYHITVGNTK